MSLKHSLLPTMQRGEDALDLGYTYKSSNINRGNILKYGCALLGLISGIAVILSIVSALYCSNVLVEVNREKVAIEEIHASVKVLWDKIQMSDVHRSPTTQKLTQDDADNSASERFDNEEYEFGSSETLDESETSEERDNVDLENELVEESSGDDSADDVDGDDNLYDDEDVFEDTHVSSVLLLSFS